MKKVNGDAKQLSKKDRENRKRRALEEALHNSERSNMDKLFSKLVMMKMESNKNRVNAPMKTSSSKRNEVGPRKESKPNQKVISYTKINSILGRCHDDRNRRQRSKQDGGASIQHKPILRGGRTLRDMTSDAPEGRRGNGMDPRGSNPAGRKKKGGKRR